jgi:hypothetical protein
MTTWFGAEGEDIGDHITLRETGNQLYCGDTAVMQLATAFTEALKAHGTKSESMKQEKALGKGLKCLFLKADGSSLSLAATEDGCPCPRTRIRKDGQCLMMEDESVDPIPTDDAMPGMK